MAEIITGLITINPPIGGRVPVSLVVDIKFTQREVDEKLDYGVNVQLLYYPLGVQIAAKHKGMTAMSLITVPLKASSLLVPAVGPANKVIKPASTS